MNVLLVGQGYVGLPVSMAAVTAGFHVTGFDTDATKADTLASGGSHVEDIAPAIVQAALDSGRYNVVSSPDELGPFDVAVITCLLYTSPSPRDRTRSRMPSSA